MSDVRIEGFVTEFAWILLAAVLVGMVAQRIGVSYAVALVIAGLIVEETHLIAAPVLDSGLVLFLFLPPLLFDASFRIDPREIRLVARPVALLAVPGVLVTALLVGVVLWLTLDVSFGVGLLFGSIVAATDPVAVLGIVKNLNVPHRLAIIPEAESLVNDGMAITLYTALIGYA
ncbi:MAG: cation:proton antiporter, partial [Thermomicrobiales bacterium]